MSASEDKKQEIHDEIRKKGSKQKYILSEMERLGFWNGDKKQFLEVEEFIKKEASLRKELAELVHKRTIAEDPEKYLKAVHERRKKESKAKQAENKLKRKQKREERLKKWQQRKANEIFYLGENYSSDLHKTQSDESKLAKFNLPVLHAGIDLAKAIGIELKEIQFLAFASNINHTQHYKKFFIPKKRGGRRLISAPQPRLKSLQHWILHNILNRIEYHVAAHGCVQGRSIKSNAENHIGKEVVINWDLKDFFPTVLYTRVKGLFQWMGYSPEISTILALLCTEPDCQEINLFGKKVYASKSERFLPQGSPCSPALANLACYKLDTRLTGLAKKYSFHYSRYVDDITFSGANKPQSIKRIIGLTKSVIKEEGFTPHPDKLRVLTKGRRQEVTGVVVNKKLNINKVNVKKFRAMVHTAKTKGLDAVHWKGADPLCSLLGYYQFIKLINPALAAKYSEDIEEITRANKPVKEKPSFFKKLFSRRKN